MPSWCTLSTLYKGLLTLVAVLILLEYLYGSIQTRSWDRVINVSATRLPSTVASVEQIHSPILKVPPSNDNRSIVLKALLNSNSSTSHRNIQIFRIYSNESSDATSTFTTQNASNVPNINSIFELSSVAIGIESSSVHPRLNSTVLPFCPETPLGLDGRIPVIKNDVPTVRELEARFSWLKPGGHWAPEVCKVEKAVAIIIPFRCRGEHLLIFLQHMHPFLKKQQVDYTIFIIEQNGNQPFNRAMLMNIGFKEALKLRNYDCFIFHDIDLLPENDRNLYTCPIQPRHMSVAIDIFKYKLPYRAIFGGVSAITREHFQLLNGFSNLYWGWGGEDDDMSNRIKYHKLHISRYPLTIARYTMLQHKKDKPSPNRYDLLKNGNRRFKTEGLNSLIYSVKQLKQNLLYTWILVQIDPPS